MFPNIDNELGVSACRKRLEEREVLFPSTDCIIEGLVISLEENIAQFGTTVAKQHKGTAMGPHHSCSYADIAVDMEIDVKVMSPVINKYFNHIGIWARFRDDIYCCWLGTEDELLEFHSWVNQLSSSLKFTHEYSTDSIIVLDLEIYTNGQCIATRQTCKACDPHAYLQCLLPAILLTFVETYLGA